MKFLATALKNLFRRLLKKTETPQANGQTAISKQFDQRLVFKLAKKNRPTLAQLKLLPKFLSPQEKTAVKILSLAIFLCLILLTGNFYFSHTRLLPDAGGTYTEGLVGTPQYINPILSSYNDVDRDLARLIFNGLLKASNEGLLIPDLAKEFQISPDGKIYTFKLREDVFWHDGQPLTASDVIFTVTSVQDPEWQSQLKSALGNVQVEKIDDYTVRFILKDKNVNFAGSLTFGILPEHLWLTIPPRNAALAELNKKPVGTGPFKFKSLTKDKNGNIRTLTLERNGQYFGDQAYIKELVFKFYGDLETATDALANNYIEGLSFLPKEFQDKVAQNKNLKFYSLSLPQYTAIFFNTKRSEALKSKEVRQALAFAIDRPTILKESLNEKGVLINGPILPGYLGFHPDIKKYNYDPEAAKKILGDAGWKAGEGGILKKGEETLQLTLTTLERADYVKAAEIIKANWEAIGASVALEIISKERIKSDIIEPRQYQAFLYGQITGNDPYGFWHSSGIENPGVNLAVWANRDVDKILEESRSLENLEALNKNYQRFQDILAEQIPAIFLYDPIHTYPVHEKIKGFTTRRIAVPADRFTRITDWYIKTRREFSWKTAPEN
ncbi:MAG: hypothetical protein A2840_00975 [Candidatus Buchananbacteria bacterium RIFCSPHIGHO2_01_FULL_47_11b]|uniref:Solute-binding protein family 5 domain-containing protein n=1 Tax=Candidatus Buchananbacteria bacterium RIFCSPHIGHO2_01_FULL_47_11b TaxID=1797537 RepID=A0A1G1Y457_9BACT|nr:MAG: hypothetical protein A2840_00975 [Candidatus Buchananbacteria bacterium RIFCSPHIGHO2_01_FULL_47_11b]